MSESPSVYNERMPAGGIRPRGVLEKIDDPWKAAVDAWIRATKDMHRKELARLVRARVDVRSCSGPAITRLLTPIAEGGPRQSRIARAVAEITGIRLPNDPAPEFLGIMEDLRRVEKSNPSRYVVIVDMVRRMLADPK